MEAIHNLSINNETGYTVVQQLKLEYLNDEEAETIQQLCLNFADIFYPGGDH